MGFFSNNNTWELIDALERLERFRMDGRIILSQVADEILAKKKAFCWLMLQEKIIENAQAWCTYDIVRKFWKQGIITKKELKEFYKDKIK